MSRSHVRLAAPRGTEHLVEHVWVMRAAASSVWRALLVPNGRPSVVVRLGEPGKRIDPLELEGEPNDSAVAGVRRLPVVLEHSSEAWYVGARLRPYGLAALGLQGRYVDETAPLDVLETAGVDVALLGTAVRLARTDEERAEALARPLAEALEPEAVPPDRVAMIDRAIEVLDSRRGLVTAVDLGRAVGVPPMILDTALDAYVGVGLEELTAVTRFHHFVGGPGGLDQGETALRALEHYRVTGRAPRETLRLTGLTPAQFARVREAISSIFAQSPV